MGCCPWGREESDTTERFYFPFSLSCTGEGNGNLLQRSCLENPMDGGAWWAAVCGVAQSRTRLKRLGSSGRSGHSLAYNISSFILNLLYYYYYIVWQHYQLPILVLMAIWVVFNFLLHDHEFGDQMYAFY